MLKIIRELLLLAIHNIDSGNSNITEEEGVQAIEFMKKLMDKEKRLSKYLVCQYLNISRATLGNYIRSGKFPKGKRLIGFKELSWSQKELGDFIKQNKK